MIILEENDLLHYVKSIVALPVHPTKRLAYQKCMVKAKRIIMDSVKDHLIPNIGDLDTTKLMFDTLANLYENKNNNIKVALKSQI